MQPLWTVAEAVAATGGRPEGLSDGPIASVATDSREVGHETLYFALKGDMSDGHDFVEVALAGGASAVVVSEAWTATHHGDRQIVVTDTAAALATLARTARARSRAVFVAIAGRDAAPAREAVRTVLQAAGITYASAPGHTDPAGVTLSLARLPREAQYGVVEIGAARPGWAEAAARLLRPHVGLITAIDAAPNEPFASVTAIAEAHAEIFRGFEPGGVAVLDADHDLLHVLFAKGRELNLPSVATYGFDEGADWRVESVEAAGARSFARLRHGEDRFDLNLPLARRDIVAGAAAAIAVAALVGVEPRIATGALARLPVPASGGA